MKSLTILCTLLVGMCFNIEAGQRVTLIEHFTSAGCNPCAITNPTVDPVYEQNGNNIALIKYQVNISDCDPMYYENPNEAASRILYYYTSGSYSVPTIKLDGTFASYNSSVSAGTLNSKLTDATKVSSFWNIDLDYAFNEDYTNVTVTMKITALADQAGKLKAHMALLEKEVSYDKAPGTNGEKTFINVMRKMVPDANGTNLKTSWANGDSETLQYTIPIPYYYHKLENFAVVAFIQDDNTKSVKQAVYEAPKILEETANQPATLPVFENFEDENGNINRLLHSQLPYAHPVSQMYFSDTPLGANNSRSALLFRNYLNASSSFGVYRNPYYTMPPLDLTIKDNETVSLSYYYAYCPRTGVSTSDSLAVEISTDNGSVWSALLKKGSSELNTKEVASLPGESLRDYKQEIIDLTAYASKEEVNPIKKDFGTLIRFRVVNGRNNTLSLDQIKVEKSSGAGITKHEVAESFDIYQQQGSYLLNISFNLSKPTNNARILLYNSMGQLVSSFILGNRTTGEHNETINTPNNHPGFYIVALQLNGETLTRKIVIK